MSHTPPPLPKAGSGALKELWEETKRVLDAPRTILVLEGALDRRALEEVQQRAMKGAAPRAGQMPRAELVGRCADGYHRNVEVAYALMKELDRSCHKERHIVASIDEASIDERLATYRALDFRRERARLVWALLRDGRAAPKKSADKILTDAFTQVQNAADAHAAAAGEEQSAEGLSGLRKRLVSYEQAIQDQQQQIQREVGLKESVERERSELMARLGARERALRNEEELRRAADAEVQRLRDDVKALKQHIEEGARAGGAASSMADEIERLRDKVRALEARAERAERLAALEEELAGLRREHESEKRAWARAKLELQEQLQASAAREQSAHDKAAALRDELKAARRELAGQSQEDKPVAVSSESAVGVFVDAANLSASARRDFGSKLDYRALLQHVLDGRRKQTAIAYVVRDEDTGAHQGFVKSLREGGYEIREKTPKSRSDGSRKADWDMGIAMEILDVMDSLEVIVLCSGDGDFVPLVQRLRREGKRVEVAAFRAATDEALVKAVDAFMPLDGRFRM